MKFEIIKTNTFKKTLAIQVGTYIALVFMGIISLNELKTNEVLGLGVWSLFLLFILIAASWMAYHVALPLERLKNLMSSTLSKRPLVLSAENLLEEESGSYTEIEALFNKLNKKLIKRKQQIQKVRNEIQTVVENLNEGVVNISQDGKILFFNSQFAAQFLNSEEVSHNEIQFNDIIRDQFIYDKLDACLAEKKHQKGIVSLKTKVERLPRFFNVSFTPIIDHESKELQSIIIIFLDVTDLKLTEQIRTDFVMNASHELKTPLTILKGYAATLREDIQKQRYDSAEQFIDVCEKNINRLNALVDDLLSLAKLEHNPELKIEKFHPLVLTENLVREFDSILKKKNQKVMISCTAQELSADAAKVEIVLRNLISNAIKYSHENKTIKIIWSDTQKDFIELAVQDEGSGIPSEHLPRLFERFYRVDAGRSRDMGGTGLGLAIVKHILETHNGNVAVKSEVGKGSEFICRFPKPKITKTADITI